MSGIQQLHRHRGVAEAGGLHSSQATTFQQENEISKCFQGLIRYGPTSGKVFMLKKHRLTQTHIN